MTRRNDRQTSGTRFKHRIWCAFRITVTGSHRMLSKATSLRVKLLHTTMLNRSGEANSMLHFPCCRQCLTSFQQLPTTSHHQSGMRHLLQCLLKCHQHQVVGLDVRKPSQGQNRWPKIRLYGKEFVSGTIRVVDELVGRTSQFKKSCVHKPRNDYNSRAGLKHELIAVQHVRTQH